MQKNLKRKLVRQLKDLQKNELTTSEEFVKLLDLQEEVRRLKRPQMN